MGHDGDLGDAIVGNDLIGRDAYGLTLGYYGDADYKAIGSVWGTVAARPFAPLGTATTANTMGQQHKALYNGNIAHSVSTLQPFGLWDSGNGAQGQVLAQVYHYDQLNRLRTARGYTGLGSGNTWEGVADATTDRYRSDYTYDANGNIETAFRHNNAGARYDSLHYHYQTGTDGRLMRNRLYHLRDLAADGVVTAPDPEDLKKTLTAYDNTANTINTAGNTNNYRYDALGNLVHDEREGIANIAWTVAGKVKTVERTGSSALEPLHFAYGAGGQRIQKQVTNDPDLGTGYREHYIRDAQGNIMATYRYSLIPVPDTEPVEYLASLLLNERPLYGSSRLGSFAHNEELYDHAVVTNPGPDVMQPVDVNYEL
ncbi:MAG: hypothetical protein JNM62_09720, partial [Flavobacteriales bacterium]|nr:hypothetical protein [Flavobacteriales bacterium]